MQIQRWDERLVAWSRESGTLPAAAHFSTREVQWIFEKEATSHEEE